MRLAAFALALSIFVSFSVCARAESVRIKAESTVGIVTVTGWGTAFPVGGDFFLTANHNLLEKEDSPQLRQRISLSRDAFYWVPVEVVAQDAALDVALIKARLDADAFEFASSVDPKEKFTIPGYPERQFKEVNATFERLGSDNTIILFARGFNHGHSGSPVLNKDRKVVGIARAGIQDDGEKDLNKREAIAVHIDQVKAFLSLTPAWVASRAIPPELPGVRGTIAEAVRMPRLEVGDDKPQPTEDHTQRKKRGCLAGEFTAGESKWRVVKNGSGAFLFEKAEEDSLGDVSWRKTPPLYDNEDWAKAAILALAERACAQNVGK